MPDVPTAGLLVLSLLAAAPAEHSNFLADGAHLTWYGVAGRGVPILLIHGGLVDSHMWDDQVASLSANHCVIRYDQRGFGHSSPPTTEYSPVEDARSLLDHLGLSRAVVVGLSSGGQLAVDLALEHPERFFALITAGATVRGLPLEPVGNRPAIYRALEERGPEEAVRLWLEDPAFGTASKLPKVQERMRRMLTHNVKGWGKPHPDLVLWPARVPSDHLREIRVPTLVIRGEQENPNIRAAAEALAREVPGAKLEVIPGAGHHVNMEAPAEFDRAVLSFLRVAGVDRNPPRAAEGVCSGKPMARECPLTTSGQEPTARDRFDLAVRSRLSRFWDPESAWRAADPGGTRLLRDRYSLVEANVGPSGELGGVSLMQRSGLDFLDAAAVDAVRRAAPFDPPPPGSSREGGTRLHFGFYVATDVLPRRCGPPSTEIHSLMRVLIREQ